MSLINNMLRNLHSNGKQDKIAEPQGDLPSPPQNTTKRRIYLIIAIIIIALVVFLMLRKNKHQPTSPLTTQSTDNSTMSINHRQDQHNITANQQPKQTATLSADTADNLPVTNVDKTTGQSLSSQPHSNLSNPISAPNNTTNNSNANATASNKPITTKPLVSAKSTPNSQSSHIEIKEPPLTKEQLLAKQYNQAMEQLRQGNQHRQVIGIV
ncbi:MAG: hypothetical protein GY821_02190 [Gammaproteobacteria bacterium]|nr:hypothetical protein [Gammaproteobacteria bacterium]